MQPVAGLDAPRRIGQNDLVVLLGQDALDAMPRRLHLRGDDGQLFAHEGIEQGAFSGVRLTKYADESDFHGCVCP